MPVEIPQLQGQKSLPDVLTKKDIEQLYTVCSQSGQLQCRDRVMLDMYYACGLRRSEAVALDVCDVDLRQRRLMVRRAKNYRSRIVPFTYEVAQNMTRYFYWRTEYLGHGDEPALLINQMCRRISGQALLKRLKTLQSRCEDTTLKNKSIGLHTLRHSIATHLLHSGMDIFLISRFLGHQSLEATQIYTHLEYEKV